MTKGATLFTHHHRLQTARTRIAHHRDPLLRTHFLLYQQLGLGLHRSRRMVNHHTVPNDRVVLQGVLHGADVTVDDPRRREARPPRYRLRARIRTLHDEIVGLEGMVHAGGPTPDRRGGHEVGRRSRANQLLLGWRCARTARYVRVRDTRGALHQNVLAQLWRAQMRMTLNHLQKVRITLM